MSTHVRDGRRMTSERRWPVEYPFRNHPGVNGVLFAFGLFAIGGVIGRLIAWVLL